MQIDFSCWIRKIQALNYSSSDAVNKGVFEIFINYLFIIKLQLEQYREKAISCITRGTFFLHNYDKHQLSYQVLRLWENVLI